MCNLIAVDDNFNDKNLWTIRSVNLKIERRRYNIVPIIEYNFTIGIKRLTTTTIFKHGREFVCGGIEPCQRGLLPRGLEGGGTV